MLRIHTKYDGDMPPDPLHVLEPHYRDRVVSKARVGYLNKKRDKILFRQLSFRIIETQHTQRGIHANSVALLPDVICILGTQSTHEWHY
jgi:hypothetical protein